MADEQAVVDTPAPETVAPEITQDAEPESSSSPEQQAPEVDPKDHRKRLGGWQRKLMRQATELEYWKAQAQGKIAGDRPLSEDMDAETWARLRNKQVREGVPYSENERVLADAQRIEDKAKREAAEIVKDEEAKLAAESQAQPLTPDPDLVEAAVQQRLKQQRDMAALQAFQNDVAELSKADPEGMQRAMARSAEINLHPEVAAALTRMTYGAQAAIELAKAEPKDIQHFLSLAPADQLVVLGRVAEALEYEKTAQPKSRPPKPLSPITKPAASSNSPREEDDADTWVKKRWRQVRAQGREI